MCKFISDTDLIVAIRLTLHNICVTLDHNFAVIDSAMAVFKSRNFWFIKKWLKYKDKIMFIRETFSLGRISLSSRVVEWCTECFGRGNIPARWSLVLSRSHTLFPKALSNTVMPCALSLFANLSSCSPLPCCWFSKLRYNNVSVTDRKSATLLDDKTSIEDQFAHPDLHDAKHAMLLASQIVFNIVFDWRFIKASEGETVSLCKQASTQMAFSIYPFSAVTDV